MVFLDGAGSSRHVARQQLLVTIQPLSLMQKKNLNWIDLKNLFRLALFPKRGDAPSSAWGRAHADVRPWCGKWGCGQGARRAGERGSWAGGRAAGPAALPRPPFRGAQRVTARGRAGDGNLLPSLLPARDEAPQVHGN